MVFYACSYGFNKYLLYSTKGSNQRSNTWRSSLDLKGQAISTLEPIATTDNYKQCRYFKPIGKVFFDQSKSKDEQRLLVVGLCDNL
jgi:hypothetical protein